MIKEGVKNVAAGADPMAIKRGIEKAVDGAVEELKEIGLNTKYLGQEVEENSEFNGKTFVLTGSLQLFTREEAEEKIEQLGGKASSSVSKKTSAVIVGANPGSKYEKAKELGIPIWTEEEFKEKLGE